MRRRIRSIAYRVRRQQRHAGRHYFIEGNRPLDGAGADLAGTAGGYQVSEYRRGVEVSREIIPAVQS